MPGRSRTRRVIITATVMAGVVVAAAGVTAGLLLGAAGHPASRGRPEASSSGRDRRLALVASPSPSRSSATAASGSEAAAIANVEAFFRAYPQAAAHGKAAVDALIRARVATWYVPILEASPDSAGPPGCGVPWTAAPQYQQAGVIAGQAVVVARWRTAQQALYIIAASQPRTGKITGLTCAIGGSDVTRAGARDAAASLYEAYVAGRRQGISMPDELKARLSGGPETGSAYLQQALTASGRRPLGYDPLLCSRTGVRDVSVRSADVVAGGSAGLVTMDSGSGRPILAVIVLAAQGWAVADIACQQP